MKKLAISLFFWSSMIFSQVQVDVTVPSIGKTILNAFGLGPKEKILILNPTPFTAHLSALGGFVGIIPPSGTVWGGHSVRFSGEQYPLLAWMYDASGKKIGIAYAAPNLYERQIGSWTINQVFYPDGRYSFYNFYGTSPFGSPDLPEDKEIDFPGTALGTTVYVQFINCTYFNVEVKLGTGHFFHVPSMDDVTLPYENVLKIDGTIPANLVYTDRGRVVGWSSSIYTIWTNSTPRAVQILLMPSSIQRAPY